MEAIGNRHFGIRVLLYIAYLRYALNLPENKIVALLNAEEAVKGLETEEERSRVYAEFVERLQGFVIQKGKLEHHAIKTLAKRALKYKHELFTFMNDGNPEKRLLHPRERIYPQQIKLKK